MSDTSWLRWTSRILYAAMTLIMITNWTNSAQGAELWAYIGTYTQADSHGIYAVRFDTQTGEFGDPLLAAESENPSFLAIHPSGQYLYAVGEIGNYKDQGTGFVRAFRIDRHSGKLTPLNDQSSGGSGPCHLVVDATGNTVLVANYGSGSVASIAISADGQLGDILSTEQHTGTSVNPQRQKGPHAHSINLDSANRFAFAADLGLDKIVIYRFDAASGKLTRQGAPASPAIPPGSGPRHFAFHPTGRYAYVINELSSTLVAFRYDAQSGTLTTSQELSTLPEGFTEPSYTAEVVVHPSGRFVYGSNRGHDSIAVFRVNADTGQLSRVQIQSTEGETPRNFAVDPTGQFLLAENQGSNAVVVFRIDQETGQLSATGETVDVPMPVCLRFVGTE